MSRTKFVSPWPYLLITTALFGICLFPEVLFNLAIGWARYCFRVIPELHLKASDFSLAIICLAFLAIGLHGFLSWFARQWTGSERNDEAIRWPIRRTAAILTIVMLMFTAGISALGISHQTAWLASSPEPLFQGGISEAAAMAKSENNLKQIALAMHNYSAWNTKLPAAAIWDKSGHPLLSWRVAILPFLEESALYKEFHLDESWDSAHNLSLLSRMPNVYTHRYPPIALSEYTTHYRVFTGKGTAFDGPKGLDLETDFPDGTGTTILVVETTKPVIWTKPDELPYDAALPLPALGFQFPNKFLMAMVDGATRIGARDAPEAEIRARITRNGGEKTDPDW